ncbi:hypothetical protein J0X12_01810 [Sneathiella sp. CAU 1612]|uniref:Lipoprotein n=1 Tax=Sneathiella sedimenti TaxID=2816034 RepID=A0ABS3F1D8_9PROT|nr:hypothetical protein [Sneathiella sedimenti]MBO0332331.1 hypothetical protein [Sneathiella sedimenti]
MTIMRGLTIGALLVATVATSGCSSDIFKTVDKNVAGVFGDSCSFTNLSSGKDFCPLKSETFVQAPLYCYKTLGSVNCYREENPYSTEKSARVRKVPALASTGVENISVEELERQQEAVAKTVSAD